MLDAGRTFELQISGAGTCDGLSSSIFPEPNRKLLNRGSPLNMERALFWWVSNYSWTRELVNIYTAILTVQNCVRYE